MGDPKKMRKRYSSPKYPWDESLLESELRLLGEYGLKNKRELRTIESTLRGIRNVVRSIFALSEKERVMRTSKILSRLQRMGLIGEGVTVEEALKLSLEDILERRLQTIVYRKGLAETIFQARQLITHGHIMVGDRVMRKPGKLLKAGEEDLVQINPRSPIVKIKTS